MAPVTNDDQPDLRSQPLAALTALIEDCGGQAYRAKQLFTWLHRHRRTDLSEMHNLPASLRERLASATALRPLSVDRVQRSTDGTRKLKLCCSDGEAIESVLIPQGDRLTLCVSSQVGCALGCRFCATATMGMRRNLRVGEIVGQIYAAQDLMQRAENEDLPARISNLVFMGMGEPLANLERLLTAKDIVCHPLGADLSPRRITVSTVGLVPAIKRLGRLAPELGLAISLHATTDERRSRIMPINRRWNLRALMETLRNYPLPRRRRITFEYMLIAGFNDTLDDARRLPQLLRGIPAKVNLLSYNPCRPDQPQLQRPKQQGVAAFAEILRRQGLNATVRVSRGLDIDAACGQLALKSGSALPDTPLAETSEAAGSARAPAAGVSQHAAATAGLGSLARPT